MHAWVPAFYALYTISGGARIKITQQCENLSLTRKRRFNMRLSAVKLEKGNDKVLVHVVYKLAS